MVFPSLFSEIANFILLYPAVQNMKRIAMALCFLFGFAVFRFSRNKSPAFA